MPQDRSSWRMWAWLVAGLALAGCQEPSAKRELASPDSMVKILTIKEISRQNQRDAGTLAQLIGELENRDPAVRFYSITALRELTGETFGYRYYDHEAARRPAVEKWRQWLADQSNSGPARSAAGQTPEAETHVGQRP